MPSTLCLPAPKRLDLTTGRRRFRELWPRSDIGRSGFGERNHNAIAIASTFIDLCIKTEWDDAARAFNATCMDNDWRGDKLVQVYAKPASMRMADFTIILFGVNAGLLRDSRITPKLAGAIDPNILGVTHRFLTRRLKRFADLHAEAVRQDQTTPLRVTFAPPPPLQPQRNPSPLARHFN